MPTGINPPTDNLRHVIESMSNGWPTIARSIREADGARIADCKEEIDTLLVFAGLYSAILTAFIIESYKGLQQDPQTVMTFLLQRIADRSTTSPNPPLPPFDAPQWAIRVNVLWFTSLILSLAAASLGMLVKQWLREYLDFSNKWRSPRQQIAAREFRHASFYSAKVFEIAAVLPLLLQTSLGLFFVGLCFFTSSIHSSVGHTTIPVVAAWTFFFTITVVAPVFSPRCPYKTTFLSKPLRACRRLVAPVINPRWDLFLRYLGYDSQEKGSHTSSTKRSDWLSKLCEEDVFVNASRDDAEILLAVDLAESDDGLLAAMFDILERVNSPENLLQFVIALLNRRLERLPGCGLLVQPLICVPDLSAVPKQAWQACTESLARALIKHTRHLRKDSKCPEWAVDGAIILMAQSSYELSEEASEGLKAFFSPKGESVWCPNYGTALALRLRDGDAPLARLWKPLRSLCFSPGQHLCTTCVLDIYVKMLCRDPHHDHQSMLHILRVHRDDRAFVAANKAMLDDLFDILLDWMIHSVPQDRHVIGGTAAVFDVMIELADRLNRRDDLIHVYMLFWDSKFWYQVFARSFGAVDPHYRAWDHDTVVEILTETWRSCPPQAKHGMLKNIVRCFTQYINEKLDQIDTFVPTDFVRVCLVYLQIQQRLSTYWVDKDAMGLWKLCGKAIKRYHSSVGWDKTWKGWNVMIWVDGTCPTRAPDELLSDDKKMAAECLIIITAHDSALTAAGSTGSNRFPDELYDALSVFIDPEDLPKYPRIEEARANLAAIAAAKEAGKVQAK